MSRDASENQLMLCNADVDIRYSAQGIHGLETEILVEALVHIQIKLQLQLVTPFEKTVLASTTRHI